VDVISFDAVAGSSYQIRTFNLTNGADTYLRLYDIDSTTLIKTNDDASRFASNYFESLSSSITFKAVDSGVHYVEVSNPPEQDKTAGRYGTYAFQVLKK
jgi:hypothetical protein